MLDLYLPGDYVFSPVLCPHRHAYSTIRRPSLPALLNRSTAQVGLVIQALALLTVKAVGRLNYPKPIKTRGFRTIRPPLGSIVVTALATHAKNEGVQTQASRPIYRLETSNHAG